MLKLPAMTDSLAVALLADHTTALVVGRHRTRFLHAMTTVHVNALKPGQTALGVMATANGRHVGQFRLECEENAVVLHAAKESLESVITALTKHRVADDVRWKLAGEDGGLPLTQTVALYGETGLAAVQALVGSLELAVGHALSVGESAFGPLHLSLYEAAQSELQRTTLLVRVAPEQAEALVQALVSGGAEPLTTEAWQLARVQAQWPADAVDLLADDVALAAERLQVAVSWNKGCFLGQEVYVMARDRGELPKKLRLVSFANPAELKTGETLFVAGKAVGRVGSVAKSAQGELALVMLKRKFTDADTVVLSEAGIEGRVLAT